MAGYRIEKAPTARSSCRQCGKLIAKDEYRFGQDTFNATWFHLKCAEAGRPRAWKPFANKIPADAKAAMTKADAPAKKKKTPDRNAELERKLIADPDDEKTRLVFADWLQSKGDPWGELLSLVHAGKEKEARKHFKEHSADLTGGFAPRLLTWRRGFIDGVGFEAKKPAQAAKLFEELLGVRTAMLLRYAGFPVEPDHALIEVISRRAPPTLTGLFLWIGDGVGEIAVPSLRDLTIMVNRQIAPGQLSTLLSAAKVPKLARLTLYGTGNQEARLLSTGFLEELARSTLLKQLDMLEVTQGLLDEAGANTILANRAAFAHLRAFNLRNCGAEALLQKTFAKQMEAGFRLESEDLEGGDEIEYAK